MSDGYQEFDPNSYLGGVQTSAPVAADTNEHDPSEYLGKLTQAEKPASFLDTLKEKAHHVLKGAEYFAKGGAFAPKRTKEAVEGAASLADTTIGSVIPAVGSYVIQGVTRPFTTAEKAQEYGQEFAKATDKPFGKALGVTESPAYKNEASNRLMQFVGENVDKGAGWISEQTGLPKADVEHMINSGVMLTGHAATPIVKNVVADIGQQFAKRKAALMEGTSLQEAPAKGFADQGFNAEQQVKPTIATEPQIAPKASVEVSQPTATELAPREKAVSVISENPEMPAERLNADEIARKEQLLRDVGVENIRHSATQGDYKNASSQYITSKADNGEYAQGMTNQIAHEKEALGSHFQNVLDDTKGRIPEKGGNEIPDKIEIGRNIKDAINESYDSVKTLRNQLYQTVRDTIGDTPVQMNDVSNLLGTESKFKVGDKKGLKEAIDTRMEELGMKDKDGVLQPSNVTQAEELRKFINDEVKNNPDLYHLAKEIKDSIDNDMFRHVGGDTFEAARAKHAELQELFENPDAIRNLRKDIGVNQRIADEKVIQTMNTMPESQFQHIVSVLKDQGKDGAIADIRANLVNQIKEAGTSEVGEPWNARAAANQRAKLSNKLKVAFADDPEALAKIDKGIEAGNILHIPTRYPGAAVQTQLLKNKFGEIALQRAGALIGGAGGSIAGPVGGGAGALAGEYLGGKGATALKSARQTKQLQQEIKNGTPLGDIKYEIKE